MSMSGGAFFDRLPAAQQASLLAAATLPLQPPTEVGAMFVSIVCGRESEKQLRFWHHNLRFTIELNTSEQRRLKLSLKNA